MCRLHQNDPSQTLIGLLLVLQLSHPNNSPILIICRPFFLLSLYVESVEHYLSPVASSTNEIRCFIIVVHHSDMVSRAECHQRFGGVLQVEHITVSAQFSMHTQKVSATVGDCNLNTNRYKNKLYN